MSKRISPEDRVISYFISQPYAFVVQMLPIVRAIVRARGEEPSTPLPAKPAERRKRSRVTKAPRPPGALPHATATPTGPSGPSAQNKQMNRDYVAPAAEAAS